MWPHDHKPTELRPINLPPVKMSDEMKAAMPRRQTLFWDVDPSKVDPEKNARYVVERIMDVGNDSEVRWIWRAYPRKYLRAVLALPRVQVHDKPRSLWQLLLA